MNSGFRAGLDRQGFRVKVRPAAPADAPEWARMRTALWPESPGDHRLEIGRYFEATRREALTLVAERPAGGLCAFLEAGTRPSAEGCVSSLVGYMEGWWVDPDCRHEGIGARLVRAAEDWARGLGLSEMASDTSLDNRASQQAHRALGYAAAERLVCYRKSL